MLDLPYYNKKIIYLPMSEEMKEKYPDLIREVESQNSVIDMPFYCLSKDAYTDWKRYKHDMDGRIAILVPKIIANTTDGPLQRELEFFLRNITVRRSTNLYLMFAGIIEDGYDIRDFGLQPTHVKGSYKFVNKDKKKMFYVYIDKNPKKYIEFGNSKYLPNTNASIKTIVQSCEERKKGDKHGQKLGNSKKHFGNKKEWRRSLLRPRNDIFGHSKG